ncbi:two-component system sensor protein, alginate biosynthesis [Alcanivorax hongdengensis A-11-3]|uniref:Two-component system sensor protein, alginate biosynthesis n=1 Tax=Alcanivorax hongdengensis A-11-3 TaxID=1177179 RepID=L0WEM6_9GAMM|nr:sensor histidine kinase [Alcanivorax hongdengensis]EKF75461.1 two-component system sensor protein, alginate biosynthesis [Alcanivorax hongdengensis A-11-3]
MNEQTQDSFLPDLCSTRAVLVVVVVAELMALVVCLVATYYRAFSLQQLATTSLFVQWVGLTSAALVCQLRPRLDRLPQAWAACAVVVLVVIDTLLFSVLARLILGWVFNDVGEIYPLWDQDILVNGLIAAIIAGLVMRYFYVQEQLRQKGQAELQARIQALQSRIRPHFLFNSMNIIASLIAVDPDAAEQVVEDLSVLFRASLKNSGNEVTLAEELELCRRYIHIEQLRMGDRLQVDWQVEVDAENVLIPLLTLQPLLENAIYHGIQPLAAGGLVVIRACAEDGMLSLTVRNPKPEVGGQSHNGNRMALENIQHRLEALYGDRVVVDSRPAKEQYEIEIRYPLQR